MTRCQEETEQDPEAKDREPAEAWAEAVVARAEAAVAEAAAAVLGQARGGIVSAPIAVKGLSMNWEVPVTSSTVPNAGPP